MRRFVANNNMVLLITILLKVIKAVLFVQNVTQLLDVMTTSGGQGTAGKLCMFALQRLRRGIICGCVSVDITSVLVVLAVVFVTGNSTAVVSRKGRLAEASTICSFAMVNRRRGIRRCLSSSRVQICMTGLGHVRAKGVGHPTSKRVGSFIS